MRLHTITFLLLVALGFPPSYAATKANSFSQTFTLHNFPIVYYCASVNGGGGGGGCLSTYEVRDGAFIAFNPNSTDVTIAARLTAVGDPDFEFNNGQTGSFDFPHLVLKGYSDCVRHTGFIAQQMLGPYGVSAIAFDNTFLGTTFRLDVWSLDGKAFYFSGPADGFYGEGSDTVYPIRFEDAYYDAWKDFDRQIPVTWDSSIKRWVSPFANFWHNDSDWPEGWQTVVTVNQPAFLGQKTYTIRNIGQSGGHGHSGTIPSFGCCSNINPSSESSSACSANPFRTMCVSFGLSSYFYPASHSEDAYRFHIIGESNFADHDGQLVVAVSGDNPQGATVSVRVFPNGDGGVCGQ